MSSTIEVLLSALKTYIPFEDTDREMVQQTKNFILFSANSLSRSNEAGHVTASVWLVNKERDAVLLTHHRKLGRWMQLGGHVEEGETVFQAALREAHEESGISQITPLGHHIFDVDVHRIPSSKDVASHLHYDIRFLMEANGSPVLSDESNALSWIPLSAVADLCQDESVLRLARKTNLMLQEDSLVSI